MVRQVDLNELPRATRERFVRSLVSDLPESRPIISRPIKPKSAAPLVVLLAASIVALLALTVPRFGDVASPIQDRRYLGGYVVATALFGFAAARLLRRRALLGALPFVPGVYVFPLDVVDARTREITLYPLADLTSVDPVHHQKRGIYSHSTLWFVFPSESFAFEIKGREATEAINAKVQRARQVVLAAAQRGELYSLAAIDPFAEARSRNFEPTHDHGLLARDVPIWARFIWAITIVSGLLLGVACWRLRNWQSDGRAYRRLAASPSVEAAEVYLKAGGLHTLDVKQAVVPRAELALAMAAPAAKRANALEAFLKERPGSAVDAEARAALASAVGEEFRAEATALGLRRLIARWPNAPEVNAARAKISELGEQTLDDFRAHAKVSDPSVAPIATALLTYVSVATNPPIEVRFRRRSSAKLAEVDGLLDRGLLDDDGPSPGGRAPALPIFGDVAAREAALVVGIERSFLKVFPRDVIPLKVGAPLEDGDATLSNVSAPTVVVDWEITWSGGTFVARDRARRYLGLAVNVDVSIHAPAVDAPLVYSLRAEPPPLLVVDSKGPAGKDDDARVYDAIMITAFEASSARLLTVFFEPETAASRASL